MKVLALLAVLLTLVSYAHSQILASMGDEVWLVEGGPGNAPVLLFPVYLSEPVLTESTVTFSVVDVTATAGSDYLSPLVTTVTFLPGSKQETIRVPIIGDSDVEDTETFDVILTGGTGITVNFPFASRGYIVNDDGISGTLTADLSVREALSVMSLTVTLATTSSVDVTVWFRAYSRSNDTATPGVDYDNIDQMLSIPAGSLSASSMVSIFDDSIPESDETFTIEVYQPNKMWLTSGGNIATEFLRSTFTILDDDVVLKVNDVSHFEGTGSNTAYVFTVSLNQALKSGQSATVGLSLVHVTTNAADFSDITALSSVLSYVSGEISKVVTIYVAGDSVAESTENFQLQAEVLSSVPDSLIQAGARSVGVGTITNDDGSILLTLSRNNSNDIVLETSGSIVFTVTASGTNSGGPAGSYKVSVNSISALNTLDFSTSLAYNDLIFGQQTVTWAAGAMPPVFTFTVRLLTDLVGEVDETFNVTLTELNAVAVSGLSSYSYTLQDTTIVLGLGTATSVKEGNNALVSPNNLLIPVYMNRANSQALTLTLQYNNITDSLVAQPGIDYIGPETVTFAAGSTSTFITLTIVGDSTVELDETATVSLISVTPPVVVNSSVGSGVILNDDTYIYVDNLDVNEGDVGVTSAVIRLYSPDPFPTGASVTFFTPTTGTAVAGSDYTAAQSTVSLPGGATETYVTVFVIGDTIPEATETFRVEVTSGTGGIGPGTPSYGTVTIVNDDGPSVSVPNVAILEATGVMTFTLTLDTVPLSGAGCLASTGNLMSATPVSDFTPIRDSRVNFATNSTTAQVNITIVNDAVAEPTETLTILLKYPDYFRVPTSLLPVGRIVNDDGVQVGILSTSQYVLPEGNNGTTPFKFVIGPTGSTTGLSSSALIYFETIAETATPSSDYIPLTAQVVQIGATPVTVTVQVIGDTIPEPTETFQVRLYYPDYVFFNSPATLDLSVQAKILGDDYYANISSVSLKEKDIGDVVVNPFVFVVTFSGPSSEGSTLTYSTQDGTAISTALTNNDYQAIPVTTVTLATGSTSYNITVNVYPDNTPEANETFSVVLLSSYLMNLGSPSTGVGTIINDDYTLTVSDQSVFEADSIHPVTFTFLIDGPAQPGATFRVQTTDGTALAGTNYVAIDNTLLLDTGVTSVNITVTIIGDTLPGPSVSFNLVFSQISHIILSSTTAKVTIVNDDGPQISVAPASSLEGNTTALPLVFTITSDAIISTASAGFYVQTKKVTTTPGDFTEISTPTFVGFAIGSTTATVTVFTIGDLLIEDTETFELVITDPAYVKFNAGAPGSGLIAVGTIINDDGLGITIPNIVFAEGTSSVNTNFIFNATLVGGVAPAGATVGFTIVSGTASYPSDYVTANGTISWVTGATSALATVQVVADSIDEPQEYFSLTLNTPNKINIVGFTMANATISNDDSVLTVASPKVLEGAAGTTTPMVFNLSLSSSAPPAPFLASFTWTAVGVTATAGVDFTPASGTFTFAAGSNFGTITVIVIGDDIGEPDEVLALNITSVANLIAPNRLINGTILSDDVQLTLVNQAFYEGDSHVPYQFPIYQTVQATSTASVSFTVTSLSAVSGRDYQLLTTSQTIPLNLTGLITYIDFTLLGDSIPQGDKSFQISLFNCSGCVISGSGSATVTLWEDDIPLSFASPTYTVTETESQFNMTVTIVASQPLVTAGPNPEITVETVDGTATANSDYLSRTTTFRFQSGDSSATFTVPILGDTISEPTEYFSIVMSNPVGLKIGSPSSTVVTILDNDARLIRVSHPRVLEGGDSRSFQENIILHNLTFVVSLSGPAVAGSSITYTTKDGTANSQDYLGVNGTYTFVGGETRFEVPVPVITDWTPEPSETVLFNIVSFQGALKTDDFTNGVGTIINDDFHLYGATGVVYGQLRVNNREL